MRKSVIVTLVVALVIAAVVAAGTRVMAQDRGADVIVHFVSVSTPDTVFADDTFQVEVSGDLSLFDSGPVSVEATINLTVPADCTLDPVPPIKQVLTIGGCVHTPTTHSSDVQKLASGVHNVPLVLSL